MPLTRSKLTAAQWVGAVMALAAVANLALALLRLAETGASAHQTSTNLLYLALSVFALAGTLLSLWRPSWRPRGWLWRIVATVVILGLLGGLQYVHAWEAGNLVNYDRGFPFPWIKGAKALGSDAGVPSWHLTYRGLAADLLIWATVGYALAAFAARAKGPADVIVVGRNRRSI